MTTTAVSRNYKNFVNGEWVEARRGQTFENRNPANSDGLIGLFPSSTAEDVNDAVDAAKAAFAKWRLLPAPRRAEILYRTAEILVKRKEDLARDMTREMGKPLAETRGDVQEAIDMTYFMAGEGRRLGSDRPKAFVALGGRPLLAESLERLDRSDWIDSIVVVAPPGWEEPAILLAEELVVSKVGAVVTGGATRAESVRAGLLEVDAAAVVIIVHDAARPLVDDAVLGRVLGPLSEGWAGVVPGLPVADTVKRVAEDVVMGTVDRADLVTVQTPQAFPAETLRAAYAGELAGATDCASLVERAGGRIRIVEGDVRLLKVTTPDDLARVESWLDPVER